MESKVRRGERKKKWRDWSEKRRGGLWKGKKAPRGRWRKKG